MCFCNVKNTDNVFNNIKHETIVVEPSMLSIDDREDLLLTMYVSSITSARRSVFNDRVSLCAIIERSNIVTAIDSMDSISLSYLRFFAPPSYNSNGNSGDNDSVSLKNMRYYYDYIFIVNTECLVKLNEIVQRQMDKYIKRIIKILENHNFDEYQFTLREYESLERKINCLQKWFEIFRLTVKCEKCTKTYENIKMSIRNMIPWDNKLSTLFV